MLHTSEVHERVASVLTPPVQLYCVVPLPAVCGRTARSLSCTWTSRRMAVPTEPCCTRRGCTRGWHRFSLRRCSCTVWCRCPQCAGAPPVARAALGLAAGWQFRLSRAEAGPLALTVPEQRRRSHCGSGRRPPRMPCLGCSHRPRYRFLGRTGPRSSQKQSTSVTTAVLG